MENQEPQKTSPASLNWLYPVALVLSIAVIAFGAYLASKGKGYSLVAAGCGGAFAVLVAWPIGSAVSATRSQVNGLCDPIYERLEQFSVMLNELTEQQLLSDRAKQVAYREKDREALRRAIQEDIAKKDWEAALALVDEMDTGFGYKQEAERIRDEINQRFADHIRRQVQQGVATIDRHTANQQWAAAMREAQRLQQQFPTDEHVRNLTTEIEQRRSAFKHKLLDEYNDRIAAKDTDGAITVVKKLDFYLTPQEGLGMQDSVRQLFKDKLNRLLEQFTDAVHRNSFGEAYRIGTLIVTDYPNTQAARELRDKLDGLRARAAEPGNVGANA